MSHSKTYYQAEEAIKEFHETGDLGKLQDDLNEVDIPEYADREVFMNWIAQKINEASKLDDPRKAPCLSLTSSASLLYGIEP